MASDILVVDDEADIRSQIAGILRDEGFAVREADGSAAAYAALAARRPSLVILDVWLTGSDHDGLQILQSVRRDHDALPVVMISGHGTFDMAVSATKMGAFGFIPKPFKTDVLLHTVRRALDDARLRRENESLRLMAGVAFEDLVGESAPIRDIRRAIARVAETESRVLITGEAGTGKSLAARLIHALSARRDGPILTFSAYGLSAAEADRALFGEEGRRVGLLEEAHGGTLVLDELAHLPRDTQDRLVAALHGGRFLRAGGTAPVEVDVRALGLTAAAPAALIQEGALSPDLHQRLNVCALAMPPLRDRREDIPALARHIARRRAMGQGRRPHAMGAAAMAALQAHDWPGNLWELQNVLEHVSIMDAGDSDGPAQAEAVRAALRQKSDGESGQARLMDMPLRAARDAFERAYLDFHLRRLDGNVSRAAAFVGMDRAALHRKLRTLGMRADGAGAESPS